MKRANWFLLGILVALLVGCATTASQTVTPPAVAPVTQPVATWDNLNAWVGTWSGTWRPNFRAATLEVRGVDAGSASASVIYSYGRTPTLNVMYNSLSPPYEAGTSGIVGGNFLDGNTLMIRFPSKGITITFVMKDGNLEAKWVGPDSTVWATLKRN